jgi:hypothetical protein
MRKIWTPEEVAWLKVNYPVLPMHNVQAHLGRSKESIYGAVYTLGIKKSAEYLASPFSGRITPGKKLGGGTVFKKGQVPHNKGRKIETWMKPELIARLKKTCFKKGQLPHNTLYDGALRTRQDKSGLSYQYIRIGKAKWELLHRHVWQQHYGPIPAGKVVAFKDGNQLNCKPENLKLLTFNENMLRNSIQRFPNELISSIHTLSKLKRKIKSYEKQD